MAFFDILKKRRNQEKLNKIEQIIEEQSSAEIKSDDSNLAVLLEQLPITYDVDKTSLIEITDFRVLSKINNLVPSASVTGATLGNIIKNIKRNGNGETLYKVVLQKGGQLVDSKNLQGAKRAFTMVGNHIQENADLIPVDKVVDKGAIVRNTAGAVMSVASMIVGQYYIEQVDKQLGLISDSISMVIDFLDIQYKSQVDSLMESVYSISKFQMSSIENEELRGRELDNIQILRRECQEFLNHAENRLETFISKNCHSYNEYEKIAKEISKWTQYQNILVKLLYQIDILDFTLHLGVKSKEQCFGSFVLHKDKIENIHELLVSWHKTQCEMLKVDLNKNRKKRTGILAMLEKPISWINDDWNYQIVDSQIVNMIKGQTAELPNISYSDGNLFNEDVQIIVVDGKYYYLPTNKNK